jgi:hypothetical protein
MQNTGKVGQESEEGKLVPDDHQKWLKSGQKDSNRVWVIFCKSFWLRWLPRMDSNHDKAIQSRLCYRYTTRQYSGDEPGAIRYRKMVRSQLPKGVETLVPGGGENSKVEAGKVSRRTLV